MAERLERSDFDAAAARASADGPARVFYGLGLAVLIAAVAYVGRGVLIPIIFAVFLSFLIYTLKSSIRRIPTIGRLLPHWLCYFLAFALIVLVATFLIDIIRDNVAAIVAAAPLYEERLKALSGEGMRAIEGLGMLPREILGGVDELRRSALSMINPILSQIGAAVGSITGGAVTVILYTVFMLLERGRIFRKINLLNPDLGRRRVVNDTIAEIATLVRQYITVKTAINLVTATASYLLMLAIGVDFPGFWALLIFLFNYIPVVGAASAISLPVILSLVQPEGGGVRMALTTLVLLIGVEQTMSSAIEPRLVGRSLNLSPLIILLSLAVWASLWGFAGALLAVPMTVTVMIILTQFDQTRPIAILLSDDGQIEPIRRIPTGPRPGL